MTKFIKHRILKPGDRFFLNGIEYRKLQMKRSTVHGRTNAQNVATGEKRYIMESMDVEPVTESYLYRVIPLQNVYEPRVR